MRGLHHWGASAIVVLAALHMARTFVFGAYRKPRELNWLVGVALLLLVLGFGFTGYLLPWDQKAYWATVVGTKVPAALPVVGPAASRLMAGGPAVGAATLTRFYALHVVLLPLLTFALIAVHLLLLRRHGHAGPTTEPDPQRAVLPVPGGARRRRDSRRRPRALLARRAASRRRSNGSPIRRTRRTCRAPSGTSCRSFSS